jgi:hypothetical protein
MPDPETTDETPAATISGSTVVSVRDLGEIKDYVKGNSEKLTGLEVRVGGTETKLESLATTLEQGTTAQLRLADIAEERYNRDKEDRERHETRAEAERQRQADREGKRFALVSKAGTWIGEMLTKNWQILAVLGAILVSTGSCTETANYLLSYVGVDTGASEASAAAIPAPTPPEPLETAPAEPDAEPEGD